MQFIDKLKPPTDSKDVYVYLKNKYFILKKFYVAKSQQFVSIFHSIFTKKKISYSTNNTINLAGLLFNQAPAPLNEIQKKILNYILFSFFSRRISKKNRTIILHLGENMVRCRL
ncbi:hypothetical protein SAMN05192553_1102 [Cyclobacterium xiamenense]|uniref:Uncharacterized protein n=1 Tax=Cyclobacterium xiamenense TaxID=1297121 RepID=A0A1H7B690_9BACT|nr:hypothetical protein SAMN05192553_1102 [Cyclobacterium xiamenense]